MPVKTFRPLTPSTRYIAYADYSDITKSKPEKRLVEIRKRSGGRNHYGRVTARGIGGGHKQKVRIVDFRRPKHGVEATVAAIEYDPGRSADLDSERAVSRIRRIASGQSAGEVRASMRTLTALNG